MLTKPIDLLPLSWISALSMLKDDQIAPLMSTSKKSLGVQQKM